MIFVVTLFTTLTSNDNSNRNIKPYNESDNNNNDVTDYYKTTKPPKPNRDSMTSSIPEVIYAFHHAETCGCVYRIMNVFHAEVLKEKKEKEKEIEKEPFKREFYSDDVAFFY